MCKIESQRGRVTTFFFSSLAGKGPFPANALLRNLASEASLLKKNGGLGANPPGKFFEARWGKIVPR